MTADPTGLVGAVDLHLIDEGRHLSLHRHLGAHPLPGVPGGGGLDDDGVVGVGGAVDGGGVGFAVWAPAARAVSVVGDWNGWDPRAHGLGRVAGSGVWSVAVPEARVGHHYKFAVTGPDGTVVEHADPMARQAEVAPATASIVHVADHRWCDGEWMAARAASIPWAEPLSIYEVHVGSWRRDPTAPHRERGFREVAHELAAYVVEMGFTHVELMPVMAHPFAGSWGYQVTSYFAPVARWGSPDDLRFLIDTLHQAGVGVILDWVPAHFPKDEWALARFDGTPLYEHPDPRRGDHPDWGTHEFDLGKGGVRSFLLSNALFWLEEFHVDGLRVDAVASMLYLDYSRADGEWEPNALGGHEDLEAVSFLREMNAAVHAAHPGVLSIAEESTAWPGVSRPVDGGGLGFGFKWNMGWMHDILRYFSKDPVHRRWHHHDLTFSLEYAFSENYVLPFSHDEVVHQKGTLLTRMPGDRWQQFANLRALLGWMWAHPGKQLLFMGGEWGHEREWDHDRALDWHLLDDGRHAGVQRLVRSLNEIYRTRPALWSLDHDPAGFTWLSADDADRNIAAFVRHGAAGQALVCVANLSPEPREDHLLGLPGSGAWRVVVNTDHVDHGGSGVTMVETVGAEGPPAHGQPTSASLTLPPLGVLWLEPTSTSGP